MVAFFERLESSHKVVATGDTGGDDSFSYTGCDGTFDNCCDGVHRADNFGLELWRDVKFDLLKEVLGGTKATNDKDILFKSQYHDMKGGGVVKKHTCRILF